MAKRKMKALEVGDVLTAYHDGKASRPVPFVIDDLIPRDQLSVRARKLWRKALRKDFTDVFESCVEWQGKKGWTRQFWDWNCEVFVCGHLAEPFAGDSLATKPFGMLFARRSDEKQFAALDWNYTLSG